MRTKEKSISALAILFAATLSSCGSQQYSLVATTQMSQAPGTLQIAPKIDVVLVEDDTGRIQESYNEISQQSQGFLNSLDQQGWNYHFATLRLTSLAGTLTQAVASKQDGNWYNWNGYSSGQWVAPFPGANPATVDTLAPSIFTTISQISPFNEYTGFLQPGQATNVLNGQEPGFLTVAQNFQSAFSGKNFLRSDALLAIVMIGTGNDTSYVNMCHRADGVVVPCEQVAATPCKQLFNGTVQPTGYPAFPANAPGCSSASLSYDYFKSQIQALKSTGQQIKLYSAVATVDSATSGGLLCAGGYASPGTRYQQLAHDLGGQTYDVCKYSLSTIFPDIAQNLTQTALNYEQVYIVLKQQPDPTTVQVVKYVGGNPSNAVTIPNDPNNGWTYVGYTTQYTIDYPIPLNQESGYMIQLNGSARLEGSDSAAVTYKTPGGAAVSQGQ